jgi:hypothetical protein
MFEGIKEGWTTLGVLRRLLVVFSSVDKSLKSLADTEALRLKLAVLEHGASIEELRNTELPSDADVPLVDDEQNDEDFAEMERIEMDMKGRGRVVDDEEDLGAVLNAWKNVEEKR